MKVAELVDILKNYKADDDVDLISSEGLDEKILTKRGAKDYRENVLPSDGEEHCFTIALKLTHNGRNKYIMEDVIIAQGYL